MRLRDIPIRQKLMAVILLTSTAVLLLTCTAFLAYDVVTLHKSMMEGYMTRAKIIAANSTAALAFQNTNDAMDVLNALKTDTHIPIACIYDNSGNIFAKFPSEMPNSAFPKVDGSGYHNGHLDILCPVIQDSRILGSVYIQSDLTALTDRYQAYAWLAGFIIIASLLLAYLLSRILQKQISHPIQALANTALKVSALRDFSVRAPELGSDELGLLTRAFNQMLTEIQEQQQSLKASEANYREIFNKANDSIFVYEIETRKLLDVNQRAVEMTGYSKTELTEDADVDLSSGNPGFTQEDNYRWFERASTEGPQVFEWQIRQKDGRIRWVESSIKKSFIGGKERLLIFKRDIGDRKKAEELLKNQDFLNAVLENIPNMIFVKDAQELRFIKFNKAGEKLLGFTKSDLMGKNDYDFFPKDQADFFTEKDRKVLREGKLMDIPEEPIDTKLQGKRLLHTKKIPILDRNGTAMYLLGISEDITEQKNQERLMIYTQALETSNKELQDFVFVASHDLQEPLRKIQSFSEILRDDYAKPLGKAGLDYLERMRDAANRMQKLINDLLSLTRITTKAHPFTRLDLSKVLQEVLNDLEVHIQEKKAKFLIGPLPFIEADSTQMHQLFQNLIDNALKYQRAGVPCEIKVSAEMLEENPKDSGRRYRILVEDNGIGFDNQYKEQIFKVFERLHGRDEYEGTGIGLAICRKVVERHGGTITAEGFPGKGCVFTVILPLEQKR